MDMEKADPIALAADALSKKFNAEVVSFRGDTTLVVQPEQIVEAACILRDEFGFNMLTDLSAVDYWPRTEPRFQIVYQLFSTTQNKRITVRVPVSGVSAKAPTLEGIFPAANWFEREVWDMFGVHFVGHPDMRRMLMPEDWAGHPLRKDYPLGYEEVQFTFNRDEIAQRKPHPTE
jgi:NADH-quinone oxidoreductase subunit C